MKDKIISEIPKYIKKSKARGLKRANHKHKYIEALFSYPNKYSRDNRITYGKVEYCSICSRVNKFPLMEMAEIQGSKFSRFLSNEEIIEKYKHLPMYKLNYHPDKFIHIDQLEE